MARLLVWLSLILCSPSVFADARMAVIGDAGLTGTDLDNLRDSIGLERVQSLILPGDNLYFGRYNWTWDRWKREGFRFDVVALGNHHKGYQNEIHYFGMPGEFFSTEKNGARFLVLNSDNVENAELQCAWLDEEIEKVTEKLVFLVYHHPTFNLNAGHDWRGKEKFQRCLRAFFKKNIERLTAVLLGHDHISTLVDFGGVNAIVAGSGREVNRSTPVNYEEDGFQIKTRYLAPMTQHWVSLDIPQAADQVDVHFIRVSDQTRTCSVKIKPGMTATLGENCMKP
ncbi:MAG: metallophosphoesterase [Bdellovibrionales bacterium]